MIYSGVDLIRQADLTQQRADKLTATRATTTEQTGDRDPDARGALLRFARFVKKENQEKKDNASPRPKTAAPKQGVQAYTRAFAAVRGNDDRGRMLDIYI